MAWQDRAACRGVGTEDFYLDRGSTTQAQEIVAKYCTPCEVREQCLEAHMGEQHGIWGGTTARWRRAWRVAHPEVQVAEPPSTVEEVLAVSGFSPVADPVVWDLNKKKALRVEGTWTLQEMRKARENETN